MTLTEGEYIQLIADLLNRDPDTQRRSERVRQANRRLYRAAVSASNGTAHRADLALARAAMREETK